MIDIEPCKEYKAMMREIRHHDRIRWLERQVARKKAENTQNK